MVVETLQEHNIPLSDCRAQAYGPNMAGSYTCKGVQAQILEMCPAAIFSPCGCHTLNLCGNDAAECIPESITFFGTLQTIYSLFSSSPKRWEILTNRIGCSLHGISGTRWSDRVECVKPFAAHLRDIALALKDLLKLNMTAKTTTEIHGALSYVTSFTCVIMASTWYKILVPIDLCNKVIQARDATLDIEVQNIEELLQGLIELTQLRNNWKPIWHEVKLVASNLGIEVTLSRGRGGKRRKMTQLQDELYDADTDLSNMEVESPEEAYFRKSVFYVMLDNVVAGLTVRFNAARKISQNFSFLWKYLTMSPQELEQASASMIHEYPEDLSHDIMQEMHQLPTAHRANFGSAQLTPLELLNSLMEYKLHQLFPTCLLAYEYF